MRGGITEVKVFTVDSQIKSAHFRSQWISTSNNNDYEYPTQKFPALNNLL